HRDEAKLAAPAGLKAHILNGAGLGDAIAGSEGAVDAEFAACPHAARQAHIGQINTQSRMAIAAELIDGNRFRAEAPVNAGWERGHVCEVRKQGSLELCDEAFIEFVVTLNLLSDPG